MDLLLRDPCCAGGLALVALLGGGCLALVAARGVRALWRRRRHAGRAPLHGGRQAPAARLFLLVAVLALAGVSALLPARAAACCPDGAAADATVVLRVEGMTCGGCAAAVKVALEKLDGVRGATVSHKEKRARVVYDPERVTPADLVEVVKELGYDARVEGSS